MSPWLGLYTGVQVRQAMAHDKIIIHPALPPVRQRGQRAVAHVCPALVRNWARSPAPGPGRVADGTSESKTMVTRRPPTGRTSSQGAGVVWGRPLGDPEAPDAREINHTGPWLGETIPFLIALSYPQGDIRIQEGGQAARGTVQADRASPPPGHTSGCAFARGSSRARLIRTVDDRQDLAGGRMDRNQDPWDPTLIVGKVERFSSATRRSAQAAPAALGNHLRENPAAHFEHGPWSGVRICVILCVPSVGHERHLGPP